MNRTKNGTRRKFRKRTRRVKASTKNIGTIKRKHTKTMRKRKINSNRMKGGRKGDPKPTPSAKFLESIKRYKYLDSIRNGSNRGVWKSFFKEEKKELETLEPLMKSYKGNESKALRGDTKKYYDEISKNWPTVSAFTDYEGYRPSFTEDHMNSGAAALRNISITPNKVMQVLGI